MRRLRVRVAAGATALFLALFSGLYVQMATGHDPALGTSSAQVATTTSTATTTAQQDSAPMTTAAS